MNVATRSIPMKAETILVPIDFTPCSVAALDAATTMARGSGGKLFVVYVEEPWNAVNGPEYLYTVPEPNSDEALRRLRTFAPDKRGVPIDYHVLHGLPAEAILGFAEREHVDLVVMGTHGRRGLTALLMGSVAEAVVRRAKCPVLTVKASNKPVLVPA